MKSCALLFVLLSMFWLTNCAQSKTLATAPQRKISYVRSVPAFALRAMPKTGRSLFWGKTTPKPNQSSIGFHFIALEESELKKETRGFVCHFALDVFALSPKPRKLTRIPIIYRYTWAPKLFSLSLTWLNTKNQTIPIIIAKSFANGMYGPLGLEHVIAFPKGWASKANVSNLNFGAWHASDTGGQSNSFLVGKNNLTEIHAALWPTTDELTPEQLARDYTFTLRWKKKPSPGFVPEATGKDVLKYHFYPYQ